LIWVSDYLLSFFKAFLLTVLVEFLVFYRFERNLGVSKAFAAVFLVNSLSLPIVWFAIPLIVNDYLTYALLAEPFAVLSEATLLRILLPFSYKRAIALSMTMNMTSYLVGLAFPFLIAP
jgi:hypothetical protein